MKKQLLLAAVLVSAAASSFAEDAPVANTLNAITCDSQYESYEFAYNENNLVTREDFFVKLSDGDEVGYNEFIYNDKNQLVRNDTYQYKSELGEFVLVCYVEYTYNEQGKVATRVNYNRNPYGGDEMMLGGLLDYTYDDAGNLLKVTSYWDLDKTILFQIDEYTYENGLNTLMTTTMKGFSGSDVTAKIEKKYDDQNRLIERYNYEKDANSSDLILRTVMKYTHTDEGITVKSTQSSKGAEVGREEYFYYKAPASSVIYPMEYEYADRKFMFESCKNAMDYYAVYAQDMNSGKLTLFDLYRLEYVENPDKPQDGVNSVSMDGVNFSNMSLVRSGEEAVIRGIERGETVRVYDMAGNLIDSTVANTGVYNASNLDKGTYVVVNGSRVLKFAK